MPDQIPNFDSFNSDDEWGPVPAFTGLPAQFATKADVEQSAGVSLTAERKKKRNKKKSKGVSIPIFTAEDRSKARKLSRPTIHLTKSLGSRSFTLTRP